MSGRRSVYPGQYGSVRSFNCLVDGEKQSVAPVVGISAVRVLFPFAEGKLIFFQDLLNKNAVDKNLTWF